MRGAGTKPAPLVGHSTTDAALITPHIGTALLTRTLTSRNLRMFLFQLAGYCCCQAWPGSASRGVAAADCTQQRAASSAKRPV